MNGVIKHSYSAAELATVLLVGWPTTAKGMRQRAAVEQWAHCDVAGRGGAGGKRREYLLSGLPGALREAIATASIARAQPPAPGSPKSAELVLQQCEAIAPLAAELRNWQRERMEARAALLMEVRRIGTDIGTNRAVAALAKLAQAATLPPHLQALVPLANARPGKAGKRTLSRGSLLRWLKLAKRGTAALAPKPCRAGAPIPAWLPQLLNLYQRPTKPSLAGCLEQLVGQLPQHVPAPSASSARRWMRRINPIDLARGRMGARDLRSIRPFVKRDTRHMWPGDCYTADGHTFDAEVAHPAHGRPFRPEITSVLDVATRRCVGWSAGLAESTWAVLDAQRHAIESCGIPALWYTDRGSGYANAMQEDLVVGFAARIGITITHSLPYNSQARGLSERSHHSIWVRAAKQLPTYMGAPMDREAKQKVFKLTRGDIQASGTSRLLIPWSEFLKFCQEQVDAYNGRSHTALGKIRDPSGGKLRRQSPNDAWQAALDEGWEPARVVAEESADLFRPYKICIVNRGMVRLYNNSYFHAALAEFHGDPVHVGYDIHDASCVWVRAQTGPMICIAEFEGNRRAYFAQSVIDQAAERRAQGRIRRAAARIEEAQAELDPPALLEQGPRAAASMSFPREKRRSPAARLRTISSFISDEEVAKFQEEEATPKRIALGGLVSDDEKYGCWKEIKARRDAGETLESGDEQFYRAGLENMYFKVMQEGEQTPFIGAGAT